MAVATSRIASQARRAMLVPSQHLLAPRTHARSDNMLHPDLESVSQRKTHLGVCGALEQERRGLSFLCVSRPRTPPSNEAPAAFAGADPSPLEKERLVGGKPETHGHKRSEHKPAKLHTALGRLGFARLRLRTPCPVIRLCDHLRSAGVLARSRRTQPCCAPWAVSDGTRACITTTPHPRHEPSWKERHGARQLI